MFHQEIIDFFVSRLEPLRDEEKGKKMEAYLKGKQKHLGVQTPQRKLFYKEFKQRYKNNNDIKSVTNSEVIDIITELWNRKEREYRYVAIFLLEYFNSISISNLDFLKELIISGDWWDITDNIAPSFIGELLKTDKKTMTKVMKKWALDENMWIRRSAILCQLKFKTETDADLLEYCIKQTMHEKEFFIQKAIGWILREYAKTDPKYVRNFIDQHRNSLAKLSIREASKYL